MKRSRSVALVLMGASVTVLTACDEKKVDAALYESVGQCVADGLYDTEACESQFAAAEKVHEQSAPLFKTRDVCTAEFGPQNCVQSDTQRSEAGAGGGGLWMPLMMGYMMGRMGGGVAAQPLYRSRTDPGTFRTAGGTAAGRSTGMQRVSTQIAQSTPARSTTVSRGGFGARASRGGGFFGG